MNLNYIYRVFISFPLLPLMYFQGKRIKTKIPKLPEALGIEGQFQSNEKNGRILKVIAIGESTIAGVGVQTHEEGFTGTFAKEIVRLFDLSVHWKVYARSGYTARKVEKKIIPKITENHADLIVIGLGANDAFTLNRPSKWKIEIHSLIKSIQIKFPEAVIVFCNMPPIKEFPAFTPLIKFTVGNLVEILGEELQKVVSEYDDVFYFGEKITLKRWIDKFNLNTQKEDFFSDGIHPSKLTYQIWAKDIANQVFKTENIKKVLDGTKI